MPHHRANRTKVHGIVHRFIEERRLQNARGEVDIVHLRIVIGVNGRRRHRPFQPVHGLPDFGELPMKLEL